VIGWIGGNVLKSYRLTIDYPNRLLYWQRQRPPDRTALDAVELTLRRDGPDYFVAGVASKDGRATVAGVEVGDKLVRVDGKPMREASLGAVFAALHGRPGEPRRLDLERAGEPVSVTAEVTAF